jgi:2-polyprenyl-3-methyl-5-hydroxy-6-metoxy-1,4-benzoquinol methylase
MTGPNNSKEIHEELIRQESILWERGKFFQAYENVLGYYIVQSVLEHMKPPSLLDVACGNGLLTYMLSPHFSRVVAVDASSAHIAKAREQYPNIEFVQALAEEFQANEAFTTITMLNILEHVVDPVALLSSVTPNLALDGVLIVNVPNALAVNRRLARLMGTIEDEYELSPFDVNVAGHRRYYDMQKLVDDVEAAGLRIITKGGVFYKMLSSAQLNWFLEHGLWDEGGFGWGRVGAEKSKNWRQAFCDASYELGKERPKDCNLIYVVAQV